MLNIPEDEEEKVVLVGMNLQDGISGVEGKVVDYIAAEFNPLLELEVQGVDEEVFVPYNEEFVVDYKKRTSTVIFELPEGIFEL